MFMQRITITMDDQLLNAIDGLVDGERIKSRSQAMDNLLRKGMQSQDLHTALIIAGGEKEKLLSPNKNVIRPLIKIAGKTILEHTIEWLKGQGITHAIIAIGYGGEKIVSLLKNGDDYGIKIEYVWDVNATGTGGVLRLAEHHLKDPFLIVYGDELFRGLELKDLWKFHRSTEGICTLVLANALDTKGLGLAKMTGTKVTEFIERPTQTESHLANAGLFVCEPNVLNYIKTVPATLEKDVFPRIVADGKLYGYVYSGAWFHIKTNKDVENADANFLKSPGARTGKK